MQFAPTQVLVLQKKRLALHSTVAETAVYSEPTSDINENFSHEKSVNDKSVNPLSNLNFRNIGLLVAVAGSSSGGCDCSRA